MTQLRKRSLLPELSVETASLTLKLAYVGLVISAVFVLVGTLLLFWSDSELKRHDDLRLSANEAETARANEAAANATARASEADARAAVANAELAELNLQLAKLRAPRALSPEQQERLAAQTSSFEGQQYFALLPSARFDTKTLWRQLDKALTAGKWVRVEPMGLSIGDPPAGVLLQAPTGILLTFAPSRAADVGRAASALAEALNSLGIAADPGTNAIAEERPGVIRISIGLKPQ
jgi:hypothetical protein